MSATRDTLAGPTLRVPREADPQKIARLAGWLFIVTFVASIPAFFIFYKPVLDHPNYIVGAGADGRIALGALLEMIVIIANIGTAVVLFPILKRQNESLALGYVTARIVESVFIAVGILSLLAVVTLRQDVGAAGGDSLVIAGRSLVAIHDWTFLLGPGWVVGVGNGLILGYLMYRSGLVPRRMAWLGLIGGPLIILSGTLVLFDVIEPGSVGAGHRDDPGVLLGVVARHLPHRQGIQAVADPGGTSPRDPGTQRRRRLVRRHESDRPGRIRLGRRPTVRRTSRTPSRVAERSSSASSQRARSSVTGT